jgi:Na+/citrate or Na+/malate symporter
MFKKRLKEAAMWVVALLITILIIAIPVCLIELTGLINIHLPDYIFVALVVIFWVCFLGFYLWKWIKWQFVEPYQAAKAEKEGEE